MINTDTQDTDTKKDYCLDNERYNAIYQIKGTRNFGKALGAYWFNAEKVMRRAFYATNHTAKSFCWEQKSTGEIEQTEQECFEAIKKFEEEFEEPYNYQEQLKPVIVGLSYGQDWKTLVEMQHVFTAKAIFDYVMEFDNLNYEDKLYKFQGLANLITDSIGLIELESNSGEIGMQSIIENARKAGNAKQSPYEKAGTIAAVKQLLEERKEKLNERGGEAELIRLIIRKIDDDEIPAPDVPTERTVTAWVNQFQKNMKSTS